MRPVEFGEALAAGTRLTLFSDDKPDRLFTVIKFWMDEILGASLRIQNGVPSYEVEEGRIHYCFTCQSKKRIKTDGALEAGSGRI